MVLRRCKTGRHVGSSAFLFCCFSFFSFLLIVLAPVINVICSCPRSRFLFPLLVAARCFRFLFLAPCLGFLHIYVAIFLRCRSPRQHIIDRTRSSFHLARSPIPGDEVKSAILLILYGSCRCIIFHSGGYTPFRSTCHFGG